MVNSRGLLDFIVKALFKCQIKSIKKASKI